MLETILLIAIGAFGLGLLIVFAVAVWRGDVELVKAIGARTITLCLLSIMVAIVVVAKLFGWLTGFVPDTEWWDGAITMGVIVAMIALPMSAINVVQTAVGAWTSDAPPKSPDHLGDAITGLREANTGLIEIAKVADSEQLKVANDHLATMRRLAENR